MKKLYTLEEYKEGIKETLRVYHNFKLKEWNYYMKKTGSEGLSDELSEKTLDALKEDANNAFKECIKKIPKSLIDELGIEKVE